jgi:HD-like signal output (HDOD) protein
MGAVAGVTGTTGSDAQAASAVAAFEFVKALALELSEGKIELPSFPDVANRVQRVLADTQVAADRVVRVVGSEPALAARVIGIANSAAVNSTGRPISDLRSAVARMGFDMVRTASLAFAMSQLQRAEEFRSLERPLNLLWHRSVTISTLCFVVARKLTRLQPDAAMLTGLLHGVGRLYILTRARSHPALFADPAAYNSIVTEWHASIARAVLQNWGLPEEIVEAVAGYEDPERDLRGPVALADVLAAAGIIASFKDNPDALEARLIEHKLAQRLGLDRSTVQTLLSDSAAEIAALRAALSD